MTGTNAAGEALRRPLAALVFALALFAAACGDNKCDQCSSDADCDQGKGYVCEPYADGLNRCGDPSRRFDECPAK